MRLVLAVAVGLAMLGCTQTQTEQAPPADPSILEGVFTSAQAAEGADVYRESCAECHKEDLTGEDMAPSLIGVSFRFRWRGSTLFDIYASLRQTMPQAAPGSLTEQAYADLVAFMLAENGYPSGANALPPDEEALTRIEVQPLR